MISLASQALVESFQTEVDLKGGLETSLIDVDLSLRLEDYQFPSAERKRSKRQGKRIDSGRVKPKYLQSDNQLIERYERRVTASGVPYFHDHQEKTNSWNTSSQQELGLRITNIPLSKSGKKKLMRQMAHELSSTVSLAKFAMTDLE